MTDNWHQKLRYDELQAQGDVNCPNCGHNHAIAHDLLQGIDTSVFPTEKPMDFLYINQLFAIQKATEVLTEVERTLVSKYGDSTQQESTLNQLGERLGEIRWYQGEQAEYEQKLGRYHDQMANLSERNAERVASWERECQAITERNAERLGNWERECQARTELNNQAEIGYQQQLAQYAEAMADYNVIQEKLADLVLKEVEYLEAQGYTEAQIESLQELQTDWKVYHQMYKQYEQLKASYDTAMARVETDRQLMADRERALAALTELKTRVKTYLIPSLNRVASYLLSEMTGGEFNQVAIDESFEVYVDGQPLRTMSGSGKDITNLALRIGLGRILTHKVLGMMMLDEIDQGMDAERAAFTWECIEKVTPQIGQVLVVSHKELNSENRLVVE